MEPRIERVATLGIVGGGQLARMTALAARPLGYVTRVLASTAACSAATVAEGVTIGALDRAEDIVALARECDILTVDSEHVSAHGLALAEEHTAVHPSARVLSLVQDRRLQKQWLCSHGFPVGRYRAVGSSAELGLAVRELGGRLHIKTARHGYDGLGQHVCDGTTHTDEIIARLGARELVVETAVPFMCELSVLIARGRSGETRSYPPALNHHERGVLSWSIVPAPLSDDVTARAQQLACRIACELEVVGLLCVEMFLLPDGELLVNELAPRPHNSYHASERACATSQFEQLVRAVTGLPLGDVCVEHHTAMCNLLGELWLADEAPILSRGLTGPEVSVHWYGKKGARPGRKMGHLLAIAESAQEALARALHARNSLRPDATPVNIPLLHVFARALQRRTPRQL